MIFKPGTAPRFFFNQAEVVKTPVEKKRLRFALTLLRKTLFHKTPDVSGSVLFKMFHGFCHHHIIEKTTGDQKEKVSGRDRKKGKGNEKWKNSNLSMNRI